MEVHQPADLLAYALFENTPTVGSYRESLLAFLVCVALFELGRPATRREIFETCEERFLPNTGLGLDEIEQVVSITRKFRLLVNAGDEKVDLSEERRSQLLAASSRINLMRQEFHREIAAAVAEKIGEPLGEPLRKELHGVLEGFIQRLFHEESIALAKVFAKDGPGFDGSTTNQFSLDSLEVLVRSLANPDEKLRRAQIAAGVQSGVLNLGWKGQRYLATIYQKTVAFALLQQDPKVKRVRRRLVEERVFYLDTNVVMALMFPLDSKHEQVRTAIEAAREVHCKLLVSPRTVSELEARLKKSDERYQEFQPYDDLDFSILGDVVLRTFRSRQVGNSNLSWRAFFAALIPAADALEEMGIAVSDEDAIAASHDSRRDLVRAAVDSNKPPYAGRRVIEADADNLLLIQLRRRKIPADAMGRRVWLITLDHTLKYAERDLVNEDVYAVPSAKHVTSWATVLSPHLSPEDEDLGEYVLRVLQSQLGLVVEDPIFADVDFVAVLANSPFELDELLSSSTEKTKRVLVALSEEREIAELLEEEPSQPAERDAWGERLTEVIMQALGRMDDSSARTEAVEAELAQARGEVNELHQASAEQMRHIEDLQGLVQELKLDHGLFTRAWRRFFG